MSEWVLASSGCGSSCFCMSYIMPGFDPCIVLGAESCRHSLSALLGPCHGPSAAGTLPPCQLNAPTEGSEAIKPRRVRLPCNVIEPACWECEAFSRPACRLPVNASGHRSEYPGKDASALVLGSARCWRSPAAQSVSSDHGQAIPVLAGSLRAGRASGYVAPATSAKASNPQYC